MRSTLDPASPRSAGCELGRGLISTQPNADGCELDEGQVVGCQLVISGRDTPTLLDLVEEPFDQVACAIQIRAEADRVFAISFRREFAHALC